MDAATRAKFYPTSVLVTAPDIIFFWVARMIMAGLEFKPGKSERRGEHSVPRCLFHRADSGPERAEDVQVVRQFARSAGVDGEVRRGWCALRLDADGAERAGHPVRRKADRGGAELRDQAVERGAFPADAWAERGGAATWASTCSRFTRWKCSRGWTRRSARSRRHIDAYRFNEVAQALYDFFWGDYCDWFVEAAKTDIFAEDPARKASVLAVMDHALAAVLRLLHPFMPHITEELWASGLGEGSIQFAPPPQRKADG